MTLYFQYTDSGAHFLPDVSTHKEAIKFIKKHMPYDEAVNRLGKKYVNDSIENSVIEINNIEDLSELSYFHDVTFEYVPMIF